MHKVSKSYKQVQALKEVSLTLEPSAITALLGQNGAGKSTLLGLLSGLFAPSEGEIVFEGRTIQMQSPRDSRRIGIEMVYQDLALAGNMPIHENIFLGREVQKPLLGLPLLNKKAQREMAQEHLNRLKIHVKSVDQNVEDLSGGQRQAVAIARATAFDAKVVIMDEPTAALAIKEVGKVLDLIHILKEQKVAVIIISHRMDDIFYACDRVMALYQGTNFAESSIANTSRNEVIGWIMGTKGNTTALAHDGMVQ